MCIRDRGQFLQSRVVQLTLGVFVGSFLYALTVLRLIRGGDGTDFVPQVSVTLAFGYVLAAVAFFIAFIHHITQSIRLSHVLIDIGARTTASARRLYAGQRPSATWSPAPQTPRQGAGAVSYTHLLVPWMAFNLAGGEWLAYYGLGFAVELGALVFILRTAWTWPLTSAVPTLGT